ncbi:hypothetical protein EJ419_07295 [Alloscardovia theropitheci]|uniref:Uncharacterized protein n=1 Tax=Alloscardovia theropitheci TaxID=2496842 RepID=A0A4R0QNJ6_9BIFI|nr:hypothetical protein [Alloscardovia theropitheci]TCD53763.1 hypothetical protein EJ419_07295 [Alloscardovia theropitheci]
MASRIDDLSKRIIDLLVQAGHISESETIKSIVRAGEWAVAQCIAIGYIRQFKIKITKQDISDVLYVAKQEEDEQAIEDCQYLLQKVA